MVGILSGARKGLKMSYELDIPIIATKSYEFHKSKQTLIEYLGKLNKKNVVRIYD